MSATTAALDLTFLPAARRRDGWIVHPAIDLLFCCGGSVWIFVLIHRFALTDAAGAPLVQALFLFITLGTHLFANSHTAATLVRLFRERGNKHLSRYSTWIPLGCAAVCMAALLVEGMAGVLFKIYMLWVVQHYTSQTYGIALIYCYKRGYRLNRLEQSILRGLLYATAAFGMARQLAYPEWGNQQMLGIQVPFWRLVPQWLAGLLLFTLIGFGAAFAIVVVRKATRQKQMLPLPAFAVIVTGIGIFTADLSLSHYLWIYVPALYHGSQYVAVSAMFYINEKRLAAAGAEPDGDRRASMHLRVLGYFCLVVTGGMILYFALPSLLEEAGFRYATAAVSTFAVINFHHFMTDREIWRLRDPRVRQILLS